MTSRSSDRNNVQPDDAVSGAERFIRDAGTPDRGMYDGQRGAGWGGRPGGRHQDDDPAPASATDLASVPEPITGTAGGLGQDTHGQGGFGAMGQGTRGELDSTPGPQRRDQARGAHIGRGPRGYRRSDESIAEDIHRRLTDNPDLDATDIDVRVHESEVTLTGEVPDRDSKYLAEEIVAGVVGIGDVLNRLRAPRSLVDARRGAEPRSGGSPDDTA